MFRGNHPAKVEENGRLKLPVPFKQLLDAANVTELYVTSEDGKRAQMDVKAGDRILFGKYSGTEIKIDDQDYVIMREEEILAIL